MNELKKGLLFVVGWCLGENLYLAFSKVVWKTIKRYFPEFYQRQQAEINYEVNKNNRTIGFKAN